MGVIGTSVAIIIAADTDPMNIIALPKNSILAGTIFGSAIGWVAGSFVTITHNVVATTTLLTTGLICSVAGAKIDEMSINTDSIKLLGDNLQFDYLTDFDL